MVKNTKVWIVFLFDQHFWHLQNDKNLDFVNGFTTTKHY